MHRRAVKLHIAAQHLSIRFDAHIRYELPDRLAATASLLSQ